MYPLPTDAVRLAVPDVGSKSTVPLKVPEIINSPLGRYTMRVLTVEAPTDRANCPTDVIAPVVDTSSSSPLSNSTSNEPEGRTTAARATLVRVSRPTAARTVPVDVSDTKYEFCTLLPRETDDVALSDPRTVIEDEVKPPARKTPPSGAI